MRGSGRQHRHCDCQHQHCTKLTKPVKSRIQHSCSPVVNLWVHAQ